MHLYDFSVYSRLLHFVKSIELQQPAGDRKQCGWVGYIAQYTDGLWVGLALVLWCESHWSKFGAGGEAAFQLISKPSLCSVQNHQASPTTPLRPHALVCGHVLV